MVPSYTGWSFSSQNSSRSRPEWKYKDVVEAGAAGGASSGTFYLMNGLVPGSSPSERIGTMITIKTFECRVSWIPLTTNTPGQIRFFLVQDRQANQATPAMADVINYSTGPSVNGMRQLNNRRRFKILMDRQFEYSFSTGTAYPTRLHHYLKMRAGFQTQYNSGSAGTVGDIITNALYFIVLTSTTSTLAPTFSFLARIRYMDN